MFLNLHNSRHSSFLSFFSPVQSIDAKHIISIFPLFSTSPPCSYSFSGLSIVERVSSIGWDACLGSRGCTCSCDGEPGEVRQEFSIGISKRSSTVNLNICHAVPLKGPRACLVCSSTRRAKELTDVISDNLADIVEDTAFEETLAIIGALDSVAVVILPHAIDGMEKRLSAQCRAAA